MTHYRFLTTWLLDAPRARVWDAIHDARRWPVWWPGVERMEVLGAEERLWRSAWRSVLPYSLRFDFEIERDEPPHLLAGRATGELTGAGIWRLYEGELGTASTWEWSVATTAPWMNALGPLARPAFSWNHHRIMRRGAEGLARELGCTLIAAA